jgi:prepilin-type N-terminal cleavage/methylation domain-containing protein
VNRLEKNSAWSNFGWQPQAQLGDGKGLRNPAYLNHAKNNKRPAQAGFTLIEAMIATVLLAIAIVGLMVANQAYTQVNSAGLDMSTAEFLIEEARERTASIEFDNLAAFAGSYSPPQDIEGNSLTDFADFTQQVAVQNVSASDFTVPEAGSDFVRVTVSILHGGSAISSADWIRAR